MSMRSASSASKIGNKRKSETDLKRTVPGNIKHNLPSMVTNDFQIFDQEREISSFKTVLII